MFEQRRANSQPPLDRLGDKSFNVPSTWLSRQRLSITRIRALILLPNCNWPSPGANVLQLIAIWVGAGVARLPLPHAFGLLPFWMLVSLPRPSSVDDFAHCPGHFTILEALAICVSCKPGILYPNSFMQQRRQRQRQQHG
jgi:hypothetical protein